MTQKWYRKAEVQAAIVGTILLLVVVILVARFDRPASTQHPVIRDPAPRKEMRPEFGAALAADPKLAAIHLTIWNNADALITAENFVLNWEFRTCERVATREAVPRAQIRPVELPRRMVFGYTAKVVLPSSNGAAHLTFTDASDTVSGGLFTYAKGDVDSFWIALKTPKLPDPITGQSYDLWATFNYRNPGEGGSKQFRTDRITRDTCTRVIAR